MDVLTARVKEGKELLFQYSKSGANQIEMAVIAGKIQAYQDILDLEVLDDD